MKKPYVSGSVLCAFVALVGCYKTVGPVVTSVRIDKSGSLHYTRCNLVVGGVVPWSPDSDLENCMNESHESAEAPGPLKERTSSKESKDN
jgi:hypothetical protein